MIALDELLNFIGPELLENLAVEYEVDSSHSVRLSGPCLFTCLLNTLLNHPELTQRLLEETYFQQTGRTADHSTFGKCLARINPAYFEAIFRSLYQKLNQGMTRGDRSSLRLRLVDATTVTLSAKLLHFGILVGTRRKVGERRHVKAVFELSEQGLPNLLRLCSGQSEAADSVALGDAMLEHTNEGDLWIFDKGCHCRTRLLKLHEKGSFWLTPLSAQGIAVHKILWQAADTHSADTHSADTHSADTHSADTHSADTHSADTHSRDTHSRDTQCPILAPEKDQPTFVLRCVEEGCFANSQTSDNKKFSLMPITLLRGWRYDSHSHTWNDWTLMTNLPLSEDETHIGPYTFEEVATLYRMRWNIETFFKFIKQNLSYSHLTSRSDNGIRVMIYMRLITSLLMIWYRKLTGIDRGWKSVKFWLADDTRLWINELLKHALIVSDG